MVPTQTIPNSRYRLLSVWDTAATPKKTPTVPFVPASRSQSQSLTPRVRLEGNTAQVLFGVDLTVPRGTLHMLVGPNGCGKVRLHLRCSC